MKIETFDDYQQSVYTQTLEDGLKITLIPKKDFHSVFAALFVDAGAVDQQIVDEKGKKIIFPSGTAHFAEHKMFEKAEGDVSEIFSNYGAFSNAYTSQTQTVYYFQATEHIDDSIRLLLKFVQKPYYTQASVDKEQGIIGQELAMYQDMPDWALSLGLMTNLYQNQPLSQDIGGQISTINQLSPELLYCFHHYFYQPNKLHLKITGPIDPKKMSKLIQDTQKELTRLPADFSRINLFDDRIPVIKQAVKTMPVSTPLLTAGIKGSKRLVDVTEAVILSFASDLLLDLYFSDSSNWYMRNYNQGILDEDFSAQAEISRYYHFINFTGRGKDQQLFEQIRLQLSRIMFDPKLEQEFEVQKQATLGELSMSLDQLENNILTTIDSFDINVNVFRIIADLKTLTFKKAVDLFHDYYDIESFSVFSVKPSD
ncbi:EF-P 5-aminopentanol modification-associated protein YfmH [Oenococcus sicerae]|uniref:EF-P 5-aminopentanol modification-associated protein YfmH n=1 Tax=Oenococcus sicerae TaxID=2203724 RepID=UPI0039E77493